jgi:DinB superfamily
MYMSTVMHLIEEVKLARQSYLSQISQISEVQALFKPTPESWNVTEITEHLYWAEHGGILGMWKTLHAIRTGQYEKKFDSKFKNLPIQEIIDQTWQPKEIVPAVAAPRMGGTLIFWRNALDSLQIVLDAFSKDIQEDELRMLAHPHPISGPLDFQQRLEFLAFHIKRHQAQVSNLMH